MSNIINKLQLIIDFLNRSGVKTELRPTSGTYIITGTHYIIEEVTIKEPQEKWITKWLMYENEYGQILFERTSFQNFRIAVINYLREHNKELFDVKFKGEHNKAIGKNDETKSRMDGLAITEHVKHIVDSSRKLTADFIEEGFEIDDILNYVSELAKESVKSEFIKQTGRKIK